MRNSIILLIIAGLAFSSCKKILDLTPTREVGEENMWNTLEDARAGLFGVYGLSRAALADNERYWYYGDVRLSDFDGPVREDVKAIHNNQLNAAYPLLEALRDWRRFYAAINAANLFLERVPEVFAKDKRYVEQNLNLDVAQVKVLRAYLYFYMVRIWGDVPLITTSHDGEFANKARDDQQKVLLFAINELVDAESKLPARFTGTYPEQTGNYYGKTSWSSDLARKHSAWALLAHIYAWQGNYAESARYSQKVMDLMPSLITVSTTYPLTTSRTRAIFRGEVNEEVKCIVFGFTHRWQLGENTFTSGCLEHIAMGQPLVPNRPLPAVYVPKPTMLSIYNETGDNRFSLDTTTGIPVNDLWFYNYDKPYPLFKKVFVSNEKDYLEGPQAFANFASATVVSRFEDMALLLAEAKAVLNDKPGAITLLNQIRQKHGLPVYAEAKNGSVLDAVYKERKRELIGEGHSFYDMVRYKKIKNDDAAFNKLLNEGGLYWPVSASNLVQNPLLVQNNYWR
jgi:hypothetical protein